jgi:uncharacterized membrane protein
MRLDWSAAGAAALAGLAVVVVFAGTSQPLRGLVVVAFVAIGPGYAMVRLLRLRDRLAEAILAVALSLAAAIAIALVMVYSHLWSPRFGVAILAAVTGAFAIAGSRFEPEVRS